MYFCLLIVIITHFINDVKHILPRNKGTVNCIFCFLESLIDKMSKITQNEGVLLNNFVVQCCEYAMSDINGEDKKS